MRAFLDRVDRFLDVHLDLTPRVLVLIAALLLVPTYLFPLWKLTLFAPQYQDGLRVQIYSWRLDGGNNGQDIREVNVLNHYIGMRELDTTLIYDGGGRVPALLRRGARLSPLHAELGYLGRRCDRGWSGPGLRRNYG